MTRTMSLSKVLARLAPVAVFCIVIAGFSQPMSAQVCPPPPHSISDPNLPTDVVPCASNGINDFDDFSWRSFVALVWPAAQDQRGIPNTSVTNFPVNVPLVFETYKADWESFPPPSSPNPPPPPAPWQDFAGTNNPCKNSVNIGWGDMLLASYTKFGNLGLAGFGNFLTGPLIASGFSSQGQQTYVHYQASYNETEYNMILQFKWYLQANLGNITFCSNGATVNGWPCPAENSVDLKTSWIDMASVPQAQWSRYYIEKAWVLDQTTNACSQRDMGLVGMHIVSKTPSRPQWIWSTFEQIDNTLPVAGSTPTQNTVFNFNDGTGTAMPAQNPYCVPGQPGNPNGCPGNPTPQAMPASATEATKFNVTRVKRIGISDDTTPATNAAYQALFAQTAPSSPWQYYELVMTQWPVPGNSPQNPGDIDHSFPGRNTQTSSFANVTLETFDQQKVGTGCMNCHNATAHPGGSPTGDDFLWSLAVNAYAPPQTLSHKLLAAGKSGLNPATVKALKALAALQQSAVATNKQLMKAPQKKPTKPKSKQDK